jgi:hypothetical protein
VRRTDTNGVVVMRAAQHISADAHIASPVPNSTAGIVAYSYAETNSRLSLNQFPISPREILSALSLSHLSLDLRERDDITGGRGSEAPILLGVTRFNQFTVVIECYPAVRVS